MTEHFLRQGAETDVAVIGGGPAGLAAATALKKAGIGRVVVLERETEAGGIPRHCGHPPFGMREFSRILRGPVYAARLVQRAREAGVDIHTMASVAALHSGGNLLVSTPQGLLEMSARRIIHATGVREKPRSARLIGGARVAGICNTGALQSMVYLKHMRPFRRPVIIGSELVAMSAIMTCHHAGIRPVAMIESEGKVLARWPSGLFPPLNGIRLMTGTQIISIEGRKHVTGVRVMRAGGTIEEISCDGVVLSGRFTPESTLARSGHLGVDPGTGGPVVDQWGRCSDPAVFATGNLLRPVETAGWSWQEGKKCGEWVARDLAGDLPQDGPMVSLEAGNGIKYVMPQQIRLPVNASGTADSSGMDQVQLRVLKSISGELVARNEKGVVWRKKVRTHPERRLLVPLREIASSPAAGTVRFSIQEAS